MSYAPPPRKYYLVLPFALISLFFLSLFVPVVSPTPALTRTLPAFFNNSLGFSPTPPVPVLSGYVWSRGVRVQG